MVQQSKFRSHKSRRGPPASREVKRLLRLKLPLHLAQDTTRREVEHEEVRFWQSAISSGFSKYPQPCFAREHNFGLSVPYSNLFARKERPSHVLSSIRHSSPTGRPLVITMQPRISGSGYQTMQITKAHSTLGRPSLWPSASMFTTFPFLFQCDASVF